ncbi:MAG: efflux transporter outer membrane subunit [Desulfobulbaceae bacterium]|nr:efflux transporter outer membrane subunit [Desulfobulbaceae bacterium]
MLSISFYRKLPVNTSPGQSSRPGISLFSVSGSAGKLCLSLVSMLTVALLVSGCIVGPDFVKPDVDLEPEWIEKDAPTLKSETADFSEWWKVFNDPVLNNLIDTAYQQNLDLQISGLRIFEARARLGVAVGLQYPQTQNFGAGASADQLSKNGANEAHSDRFSYNYQMGFDAAWELDFWGRFRRGVESESASLYATMANYDDILVSLTAEVARTYVVIRTFETRIEIARENVRLQTESLRIADLRYNDGVTTRLDVTQSKGLLKQTEASIPRLEISLRQAKNALAVLLGIVPADVQAMLGKPSLIPTAPAEVAVGIPAELLRRRPDIRLAEFQAASQSAKIGVAKSDLFPRFSLMGSIGLQASEKGGVLSNDSHFSDLFSSDSITYSVGPSVQWPFFNYGRLKNNIRMQDARFQQYVINYQNTVLQAAQEVEDAMVGFLRSQEEIVLISESVDNYKSSVDISLLQYREGETSYQRVVDTQRVLTQQEDNLASTTGSIAINLIAMYKALGGGWELRLGKEFIPEQTMEEMRQRTDWGNLLPAENLPDDLESAPTGKEIPLFQMPDF